MRRAAAASCLLLVLFAAPAPAAPAQAAAPTDACAPVRAVLDPLIRPWLVHGERGPNHKAIGVAVGVYLHGLECFLGYGTTRLDGGHAPTRDTLFEIGSVTKTFTATMLALRAVRNPVFSPLSTVNVSGIPCAGGQCLHLANGMERLTYRELATFTGGMPDDPTNLTGIGMRRYTQADFIAYLNSLAAPPTGLPTVDSYSNSSYGLLGQSLMALDGYHDFADPVAFRTSFDEWIGKAITGPLGMLCTAADVAELPPSCAVDRKLATGYRFDHGRYVAVREPWPWVPWGPAGALRSDTRDLLRYVAAYLGAGSVDGIAVPRELTEAMAIARTPTEVQLTKHPAEHQAFAWVVVAPLKPPSTTVLKDGGTAGFSACVALMPGRNAGLVLLANSSRTVACGKARTALRRASKPHRAPADPGKPVPAPGWSD